MSDYKELLSKIDDIKECLFVRGVSNLGERIRTLSDCQDLIEKIENGTLIELPCKVGDKMYKICPQSKHIQFGQFWDGQKVEHPCQKCGWRGCGCHDIGFQKDWDNIVQEREMKSLEYIVRIMPYLGQIWFTTKAEAEKRLEELKGSVK